MCGSFGRFSWVSKQCSMMSLPLTLLLAVQVVSTEVTSDDIFAATPANIAIVAGKSLRLECGVAPNLTILWSYQEPTMKNASVFVYNGEKLGNKFLGDFSVDNSIMGHQDLVAKNTRLEHAGFYECVALDRANSAVQKHSAKVQLIVLESDPVCWSNLSSQNHVAAEFDTVLIQCDLNYIGRWFPTMEWSMQTRNRSYALLLTPHESLSFETMSSFVILQVNSDHNDAAIICKTYLSSSGCQFPNYASNIPDYTFYWNITLNVEYGPRKIFVQPQQDSYDVNSNLSCKADGNPVPEYTWEEIGTSAVIQGPILVISKGVTDDDAEYTYRCIARNMVQSRAMKDSIDITVAIKGTYTVRNVTIAIGVMCILLTALVIYFSIPHIKDGCERIKSVFRREEDNSEPDVVPGVQGIEEDYDNSERDPVPCDGYMDLAELAAGSAEVHAGRNPAVQNRIEIIGENDADDMDRPVQIVFPVYAEVKKVNKLHELDARKQKPLCESGGIMIAERSNNRFYGADGTEYMEMNAVTQQLPKAEPTNVAPMLETVEYASIDHRLNTPFPSPAQPQLD